jgi:hypothetical protein
MAIQHHALGFYHEAKKVDAAYYERIGSWAESVAHDVAVPAARLRGNDA